MSSESPTQPPPKRDGCDHPPGLSCPRCRQQLRSAKKQSRSGWVFISAAALLLLGLAFWMHRLQQSVDTEAENDDVKSAAKLVPDAPTTAQAPVAVPFKTERCVPWHVSAVSAPPPKSTRFLFVSSRIVDQYGLVLGGFASQCGKPLEVIASEDLKPGDLQAALAKHKPDALVLVGSAALSMIEQEVGQTPLLFASILNPHEAGLDKAGNVGVTPWVPAKPLIRHALIVLPRKKTRMAIFHAPGHMRQLADTAAKELVAAGRKAVLFEVGSSGDMTKILADAAANSDVWVVFPDRELIDRTNFNRIQVAAEDHKIPVIVSDEEHVRAGAYAGVGPDTHRIGQQLCRLAGAMKRDELPKGSHVFCPEYSFAAVHIAIVEKLGYILDHTNFTQAKMYKWH